MHGDLGILLFALLITLLMAYGLYFFVQVIWPLLPSAVALILFITLAVAVIAYPIYALARWSNRYLPSVKRDQHSENE
jgi:membrane protein implicated in regulation of membrane protease activity